MLELIVKGVNEMFELKEELSKSYKEVITVHDSEGYHVCAETNSTNLKNGR